MSGHGYALDGFTGLLTAAGVVHEDVLRHAGLPDDLLNRPSARVSTEEFFAFVEALEHCVDDPLFPVRIADGITAEWFSPPVFAALCSPNLTVAVQRLAKFKPLLGPVQILVDAKSSGLTVSYSFPESPAGPPEFIVGSEALFLVKVARMGTRSDVRPTAVTLPKLPKAKGAFEGFLGCRIDHGEPLSIQFSAADATRPFLTNNGAMWNIFEPQLRKRLADLEGTVTFADRTRGVLLEVLPSGQVAVNVVARRLALSPRTLQRRLRDEGTSFKDIVQQTRERLSRHYLGRTRLSSTEIAYLLGFEEPNSFFRAFQSWTGTTPEALRQTLQSS